jgi:Protein of unknown function (DUF1552)
MTRTSWTRRQVLRGAGVSLSLPWLETFAPRTAKAQAAATAANKRYVVLYFPNGSAEFWHPSSLSTGTGTIIQGDNWQLSPILAPLAPLKKYLTVMSNVSYAATGLQKANPSHGQLCQALMTCTIPDLNPAVCRAGVSVDQLIANAVGAKSTFPSLQLGLSTMDSYTDGTHPANSRSISWTSPTMPLYKVINPQAVFDRLVGPATAAAGMSMAPDPAAQRRQALEKSALDYIVGQTTSLQTRLSKSDGVRLDAFLTSVRDLEGRVLNVNTQLTAGCVVGTRPPLAYTTSTFVGSGQGTVMAGYDRNAHADVMIDLAVMALQCDLTRVMTFMLDDSRSDFPYIFLKLRNFTAAGSAPATLSVTNGNISSGLSGFHGLQHAGDANDGFATINYWLSTKAAAFATKLMSATEGAGNLLDSTTIHYGSGMHGGNHAGIDLPIALIGGHGGALKTDTFLPWTAGQTLDNVHLTIMQKVFGMSQLSFGASTGLATDLVA